MKPTFLKWAFLTSLSLGLQLAGSAQDQPVRTTDTADKKERDQIVITRKDGKDSKIVLELKGDQVLVNGKPVDGYEDDHISIKKGHEFSTEDFHLELDGVPMPPNAFRSQDWFSPMPPMAPEPFAARHGNAALLGVMTKKSEKGGALIERVDSGTAAAAMGLRKGDVVKRVDEIAIENPEDLVKAISQYKPGDKPKIIYLRDGKELKATAALGRNRDMVRNFRYDYKFDAPDMHEFYRDRPLVLPDEVAPGDQRNFYYHFEPRKGRLGVQAQDTEDSKGAKVLEVDEESPAAKAGLKEGDIITELDGTAISGASQLASVARNAKNKSSFPVKILRDGKAQELQIKIPKKLNTADL